MLIFCDGGESLRQQNLQDTQGSLLLLPPWVEHAFVLVSSPLPLRADYDSGQLPFSPPQASAAYSASCDMRNLVAG